MTFDEVVAYNGGRRAPEKTREPAEAFFSMYLKTKKRGPDITDEGQRNVAIYQRMT
jgi:hypothetical protein